MASAPPDVRRSTHQYSSPRDPMVRLLLSGLLHLAALRDTGTVGIARFTAIDVRHADTVQAMVWYPSSDSARATALGLHTLAVAPDGQLAAGAEHRPLIVAIEQQCDIQPPGGRSEPLSAGRQEFGCALGTWSASKWCHGRAGSSSSAKGRYGMRTAAPAPSRPLMSRGSSGSGGRTGSASTT
jgi:hypothetical protein